ncbi:hypothetical protein Goshw_015730, partial [Gossypium schwendimanii]|nr:hypothetical protein [Gossypium schwendimanii]
MEKEMVSWSRSKEEDHKRNGVFSVPSPDHEDELLFSTNRRIYPGSRRTTETSQKPHKILCTSKPLWVVFEVMERDIFMSATEAQAHGIMDLVV